jgi:poly(3-hydroxyoctanoate) depolymerase
MRLVFLPGAAGAGAFWQPLRALLPAGWDATLLDWPGLGDVPPSPEVNAFDDLVRLTLRVMGGPVDLVAQSMGGVVALQIALERPELVRRLVLVATSGGLDLKRFGAGDWRENYVRRFPRARRFIVDQRPDLTGHLAGMLAPTLLVWGDADPISPPAVGRHLAGVLPRAELVVIPGGDHALGRDRAAEVAPHVLRHLA